MITLSEAEQLSGWHAILIINGDETCSPVEFNADGAGGTEPTIRAYPERGGDPRFMPEASVSTYTSLKALMPSFARQARKAHRPILVAIPAAVAALMCGHNVTKVQAA